MMVITPLQLGRHTWIQQVSRLGSVCVSLLGCRILQYGVILVFDKAKIEFVNKLLNSLVCFLYQLGFPRGL